MEDDDVTRSSAGGAHGPGGRFDADDGVGDPDGEGSGDGGEKDEEDVAVLLADGVCALREDGYGWEGRMRVKVGCGGDTRSGRRSHGRLSFSYKEAQRHAPL